MNIELVKKQISMEASIGLAVIPSVHHVRIKRALLEAKMVEAGLDPKDLGEKTDKSAFIASVRGLEEDGILTKVDDPHDWTTYQVNVAALVPGGEAGMASLDIKKKAVIRFYKPGRSSKGGTVESDTPEVVDIVLASMELEKSIVRTSAITSMIERVLKREIGISDIIDLRWMGGAWYAPHSAAPILEKLEKFVCSLPLCTFLVVPIAGEKKGQVWEAVHHNINKRLKNLEEKRERIAEMLRDGKSPREGTAPGIMQEYREALEQAKAYSEFLEVNAADLEAKIAEGEARLRAEI